MFRMTHFQDLLKPLSSSNFDKQVSVSGADKYSKGFRSKHLLLTLIAGQLQGTKSFRELETTINSHESSFYHLGLKKVHRSTLSDAMKKRSDIPFKEACEQLMRMVHRSLRKDCKELLYLIDSTNIPLHSAPYLSWTEARKNTRLKGLKMHVQIEAEQSVPTYINVDHANVNDITDAQNITIEEGATYTFDKGYTSYNWWKHINDKKAFFVTRLKKNAAYQVKSEVTCLENAENIISDQVIHLTNKKPRGGCINHYANQNLRLVTVMREAGKKPLLLVTNDFKRSAESIAGIYKKRWGIELFFKWVKQNLKIKKFLGTSENAVRLQLYSAMIAYLLVAIAHYKKQTTKTLKETFMTIKSLLFLPVDPAGQYQRERYRRKREYEAFLAKQPCLFGYSGQ